ncbi:LOW QUALITY PROTEIN: endoglucanase-like [Paramacrobiotus metropolitanus]|uniref:LOW QUALITY PROTEIN: endoglucanase-like n=1 Tax=Paramacrobiotus metropolitanus TaxID=2943436 RepID=UPI00244656C1|nr:LOW QUALITY PROTEIN: endoglucanase-like [Paramacrobiotus metropolitanus]
MILLLQPVLSIDWNGNWAMGCDFAGNDLRQAQLPGDQCGDHCADNTNCTHFAWSNWNGGTCTLKGGSVSKQDAVDSGDSSTVCGSSGGIQWQGNWAMGCDFPGNDLGQAAMPGERCGGHCASNPACTHFAWSNWNGGVCTLKGGSISKANAINSGDTSTVCGVIREIPETSGGQPSGSSQSGKTTRYWDAVLTTRYWDCCKPSCAWSGKADVSNPVKTCRNDGFSQLWDFNVRSGCDGSDAFVCNDNIPWAVNDNLAYGFAAANIRGSDERGWCCGCYKLEFTSGPVSGKSMIVQVVNTGADLGENHFDLQIPGSGFGIFDGCTRQWGLPASNWGNRDGGVWLRDMCNGLPDAIREGCYWRFVWFKGADNPSINFAPVQCPAELSQKSNCARR